MKAVQIKMARAGLGWGVRELANAAGLTPATVSRIENGSDSRVSTMEALTRALEAAGAAFDDNLDGAAVRIRHRFSHDVTHLHNLWKRRPELEDLRLATSLRIDLVDAGLLCRSPDGRQIGHITIMDEVISTDPKVPLRRNDRLDHLEIRHWIELASLSVRK